MGWLHSRPKVHDKDELKLSRHESLPESDPLLGFPECDQFIASCWHDLGLTSSEGMGENPVKWSEVKSYADLMQLELSPFETESIVNMSKAYIRFKHEATEFRGVQSPYSPEITKEDQIKRVEHFERKIKPSK